MLFAVASGVFAAGFITVADADIVGNSSASTVIQVTIQPIRHIVVDRRGIITAIYSNTGQNIDPTVYVESDSGQPIVMTPFILEQYQRILNGLDTTKTGEIYHFAKVDQFNLLYLNH